MERRQSPKQQQQQQAPDDAEYTAGDAVALADGRHAEVLAVEISPYVNAPGQATTLVVMTRTSPPKILLVPDWMVRRAS